MRLNGVPLSVYKVLNVSAEYATAIATAEIKAYLERLSKTVVAPKANEWVNYEIVLGENLIIDERLTKNDSFLLKAEKNKIFISGKTSTGTLYGAYYFLEKYLGVEWLTDDCEVIRPQENVFLTEEIYNFSMEYRVAFCFSAFEKRYRARHRLNYMQKPTQGADDSGNIGVSFAWGTYGHTFDLLVPYDAYYKGHPEYFSYSDYHVGEKGYNQLCTTNPEVIKIATENALQELRKYPDCRILSVAQNDAYNEFEKNYCKCPRCQAVLKKGGNLSDLYIQFVNEIARAVKNEFPNTLVHTFAYHFTEEPPVWMKPDENVVVQYCLHLPPCGSVLDNNETARTVKRQLEGWKKITKHLWAWTYLIDFQNYFTPYGNLRTLYENTSYLLKLGCTGLFQQDQGGDFYNCGLSELRSYLTAKLLSYPTMRYDEYQKLIAFYLESYYGDAGKYIGEYLTLLETKMSNLQTLMSIQEKIDIFADEKLVKEGETLFEKAFASIHNDEFYACRVERIMQTLVYIKCVLLYQQNQMLAYQTLRKKFIETVKKYGVKTCSEGRAMPATERIDYSTHPFILLTKGETATIKLGEQSKRYFSTSCDKKSENYGFSFTLLHDGDTLILSVRVEDSNIYTLPKERIGCWEQDCVEIYVSETYNRESYVLDGDYGVRVNADGVYFSDKGANKIKFCKAERTDNGYTIEISLTLPYEKNDGLFGLEITSHNFDDGKYMDTARWSTVRGESIYSRLCYSGKLKVER